MSIPDATKLLDATGVAGSRDLFAIREPWEAALACPVCDGPLRVTLIVCPPQRTWCDAILHTNEAPHSEHRALDSLEWCTTVERVRDEWIRQTFVKLGAYRTTTGM